MINKLQLVYGTSTNPYENLALEQWLLEKADANSCTLFLWQNAQTVVIGRNQNAWRECNVEQLRADGGCLARRLSGGGAVYHDLGNLNYTFLMPREDYNIAQQLKVITRACALLGIEVKRSGRNDLTVNGQKISGSAFCHHEGRSFHHGTLLVNTDMDAMERYLNPSRAKLEAKGVESVKSRVTNLTEVLPTLTVDDLKDALAVAFEQVYGLPVAILEADDINTAAVAKLKEHFESWDWNYGAQKQPFTYELERRFSWGEIQLELEITKGFITDARVYTDSLDLEIAETLQKTLNGCRFDADSISGALAKGELSPFIAIDIIRLLNSSITPSPKSEEESTAKDYGLMVIGAGPGGYTAALKAAELGIKTALVEKDLIGGTCLNRGCVPTKTLLHASEVYGDIAAGAAFGIHAENVSLNMDELFSYKEQVVETLRKGIEGLLSRAKVDVIPGKATILKPGVVEVTPQEGSAEKATYTTENILIATGSAPARPPIPGLDLPGVMTSDELLAKTDRLLDSLVIIGGGVIGVEFASFYEALGIQVTIVEGLDRLLPTLDKELGQSIAAILKKQGVEIYTKSMVQKIEQEDAGLAVHFACNDDQKCIRGEAVLCAVGRTPYHRDLFAPELEPNMQGRALAVDSKFKTNIPGIYAIGDVSSPVQLAHVAAAQGTACVEMIAGHKSSVDLNVIPSCVYCSPEIASVGLTEAQAKEEGIPVKVGKCAMGGNARTLIAGAGRSFMKIVVHAENNRILGAQLMCTNASDMISQISVAIANNMTTEQLLKAMRPHPTFEEALTQALEGLK